MTKSGEGGTFAYTSRTVSALITDPLNLANLYASAAGN